jgi:ABC-2 type transport system ATP-binding protein
MIRVENLRKSYGRTLALDGISFEVPPGSTFGFLGPNGAGKTTAIKILCGLLKPDSGQVSIDGKADPTLAAVRLSLGVVPQTLAVYDELSAEQNLTFFAKMYGMKGTKLRDNVRRCLELAGLEKRSRQRVDKYSGGMKRRLNLACSLLHQPPVLLLDEPTVGVDPQSRNAIFDTIERMKADGRTIIYTTHYMEEAERLCDTVAILDNGRILDMDSVENLIARHGGLALVEAELDKPPDDPERIRQSVTGENMQIDGTTIRFDTNQPMETLASLNRTGLHLRTLAVKTPSLENVFLNLTGRSLRDR